MNEYQELALRTVGVFSGVFFTVSWAIKSSIKKDELFTIGIIVSAIIAAHYRFK